MASSGLILANKLVVLVLKYRGVQSSRFRTEEDKALLFDVLVAAGFHPKLIVPGHMGSSYKQRSMGGGMERAYTVNSSSRVKVITDQGPDEAATGWLNDLVAWVWNRTADRRDQNTVAGEVLEEIRKSRPLPPIHLSAVGDVLVELRPKELQGDRGNYMPTHTRDGWPVEGEEEVGIHAVCGGYLERKVVTERRHVIACRNCPLWVPIPNSVQTYGDLRKALEGLQPKVRRKRRESGKSKTPKHDKKDVGTSDQSLISSRD